MCLIVFDWQPEAEDGPVLTLTANRDEFFRRTSAPLAWWEEVPGVLAGRDLVRRRREAQRLQRGLEVRGRVGGHRVAPRRARERGPADHDPVHRGAGEVHGGRRPGRAR